MTQKQKGFTLIELLVVIAIIGILSSTILVSLSGARSKARDARRQSDIRQLSLAMELDYSDDEMYSQVDGSSGAPAKIPCTVPGCTAAVDGRYLDPVPEDPQGGTYNWIDNINFSQGCSSQRYCVYVQLEEGVDVWFAASEKGSRNLNVEPTQCPCW